MLQGRIPTAFERIHHQVVLRFRDIVLPPRTLRLVARLAQFQLQGPARGVTLINCVVGGAQRGFHGSGGNDMQHLTLDGLIHTQPAEAHALLRETVVEVRAKALIAGGRTMLAAGGHMQATSATTTPQEPGQKTLASSHGAFRHGSPHIGVVGQHLLVALVAVPQI